MSSPPHDPGSSADTRRGPEHTHGLCPTCRHVRIVRSDRGSSFFLCRRAASDPRYRKYPPQPVVTCPGHER